MKLLKRHDTDGAVVMRATMPGLDLDKDVHITVRDGLLHVEAARREEQHTEEDGYTRHEVRTTSYERVVPLPEGLTLDDVTTTYEDGILEVRLPESSAPTAHTAA